MDDNRKHQDTDFSEDDMRLLYALGEATGDLPSPTKRSRHGRRSRQSTARIAADGAAARPQYGHWRRLPPWR